MEKHDASIGQKILDHVTAALRNGAIRPGDRIIAKTIAERVGTSSIPVREILYQLVGREMVIERYREGFYAAPLNAVILDSLYREHARVIDTCAEFWSPGAPGVGLLRDPWELFALIAAQSRSPALIGVQRYLTGRLAVVHRHEMDRATSRNLVAALIEALRGGSVDRIRSECARFHQQCSENVPAIIHDISLA